MDGQKINEISKLVSSYTKNLPEKIHAIELMWQQLLLTFNETQLEELRFKIHSLRGSAGMYGFQRITEHTALFEAIICEIIKTKTITVEQTNEVKELIKNIYQEMTVKENQNNPLTAQLIDKITAAYTVKKIYIVDADKSWQEMIANQLKVLDYDVYSYQTMADLLVEEKANEAVIFIINISMVDKKQLEELDHQFGRYKIIFTTDINTFENRFMAVKYQGASFLEKPVRVNELLVEINKMKYLLDNNYKILIIDDDPEVTSYYSAILNENNIDSHFINDAKLTEVALHQFNPDLLLVDYQMPYCNGIELAMIIRQNKLYEDMPIIFLSAESSQSVKSLAMTVGADDFINKSLPVDLVVSKIKNNINRYKMIKALMIEDPLTGIFNATFIRRQLEIELKECKKSRLYLSIAMINVDKWNDINTTYGYGVGDQVLKTLCELISSSIFGAYVAGRYTKNEIMIILSDRSLNSAQNLLNIIKDKFKATVFQAENQTFKASFTAGIATTSQTSDSKELISAAMAALKIEKEKNKESNLITSPPAS